MQQRTTISVTAVVAEEQVQEQVLVQVQVLDQVLVREQARVLEVELATIYPSRVPNVPLTACISREPSQ